MSDLPSCVACGLIDAPYYDENGLCPFCSPQCHNGDWLVSPQSHSIQAVETPTTQTARNSSSELQRRAQEVIAHYGGQRPAAAALSKQLGEKINHGVLGLAARGEDFPKARRVLGLPMKAIPVEPCPDCGHIHRQMKSCRPGRKSDKRTLAFRVDDDGYERTRESIRRYPGGRAAWLARATELMEHID